MATSTANNATALDAGIKVKRFRGRRYCCVIGCFNQEGSTKGVSFYNFPARPWEKERRQRWIQAVRRVEPDGKAWQPSANTRICSQHFVGNSKSNSMYHPSYVPTIFPAAYHRPSPCDPSGQEERYRRWIERARACKKSLKDDQASQGSEQRASKRRVPSTKEHSTIVNVMNNSTSANILNASAVASLGMSPTDLVEVHLLELPDVVQDTISAAKSTQSDCTNLLQLPDDSEISKDTSSATESKEQHQMLATPSNPAAAAAIEPTTQAAPANATSQESANPCPPELLLPHAKKVEILADVRAGKLSKAEIVYKYHIRWAILYDVIRSASEIDAEQRRLGLAPETPDSHPVVEACGSKRRPGTSKSKEGQQKAPGAFFMSEDLYFNPPKKRNVPPGYSRRHAKLLMEDFPTAVSTKETRYTTKQTGKAGGGTSTKTSKPPPADLRAVSTQTLRSFGKGSLMTFMSTTNGTDAMTQVNHRRQADKYLCGTALHSGGRFPQLADPNSESAVNASKAQGSGTATQDFQKRLSDVNPDGDGESARSPEHLRHFHAANDYSKANRGKVIGTRRSNAAPSPQSESLTELAGAPASAQSPGFTVTVVKQEVASDSDTEDVVYDPLVVPKQEPLSPQEEEHCDDFEEHCDDFGEHCDDFVMKCEVDDDDSDEQTLQPPPPVVTSPVSQWDNVTVKTEPPSP